MQAIEPIEPTEAAEATAVPGVETGPAPATQTGPAPATQTGPATDLAADLFAITVFMNKNCNQDLFEAVGMLELTLTQIKLLHFLEDDAALSLKDVAERVHISFPAASRTVDDLVRRGFVERHEDPDDRRMKRVSATEAGQAVIRRLNAARLTGLQRFVDELDDAERNALATALTKLLDRPEISACRLETPAGATE